MLSSHQHQFIVSGNQQVVVPPSSSKHRVRVSQIYGTFSTYVVLLLNVQNSYRTLDFYSSNTIAIFQSGAFLYTKEEISCFQTRQSVLIAGELNVQTGEEPDSASFKGCSHRNQPYLPNGKKTNIRTWADNKSGQCRCIVNGRLQGNSFGCNIYCSDPGSRAPLFRLLQI